jgi:response regulator RpfG family c-di-GMP phosphodiesterase
MEMKENEVTMIKRIRQFLQNISYGYQIVDLDFLSVYLSRRETALFGRLQKSEQIHAILVAKGVLTELNPEESRNYVKAVLFHDIGKIDRPLNIIEKSLAVIVNKLFQDRTSIEKFEFMKSFRNHGPRGEEILRKEEIFEDEPLFYEVVGTHQESVEKISISKNEELLFYHCLLKKYDERY